MSGQWKVLCRKPHRPGEEGTHHSSIEISAVQGVKHLSPRGLDHFGFLARVVIVKERMQAEAEEDQGRAKPSPSRLLDPFEFCELTKAL